MTGSTRSALIYQDGKISVAVTVGEISIGHRFIQPIDL